MMLQLTVEEVFRLHAALEMYCNLTGREQTTKAKEELSILYGKIDSIVSQLDTRTEKKVRGK